MASTRDLRIRLSPRQHEKIRERAKSRGGTISQYMRSLILEYDDANIVNKILEMGRLIKEVHNKVCLEGKWTKKN